jgi:hypothetical protein
MVISFNPDFQTTSFQYIFSKCKNGKIFEEQQCFFKVPKYIVKFSMLPKITRKVFKKT